MRGQFVHVAVSFYSEQSIRVNASVSCFTRIKLAVIALVLIALQPKIRDNWRVEYSSRLPTYRSIHLEIAVPRPAFQRRVPLFTLLMGVVLLGSASGFLLRPTPSGTRVIRIASAYLKTLSEDEKKICLLAYDSPERQAWHFIPKDARKGLKFGEMKPETRELALKLLSGVLSEIGYEKAKSIMQLEGLLDALEKGRANRMIRDPERYYITLFGAPDAQKTWGISIEGHHMSFNFSVADGEITAHTPYFFGVNPAEVKNSPLPSIPVKQQILKQEESLGFELVNSLTPEQKKEAVVAAEAPADVAAAGEPHPRIDMPQGIPFSKLQAAQQEMLKNLVTACASAMVDDVNARDLADIETTGWDQVHFAWAGAFEPGIGHYYRIQGPTFQIEFCNNQPDAEGNKANHIHLQWRDPRGDFGVARSQ